MPNWCSNSLTIRGDASTLVALKEIIELGDEGLLQAIKPMPKELEGTTAPSENGEDWYNWRVQNWGTKWDVTAEGLEYTDHGDGTATIEGYMDSAWSPPIDAFETLSQDWDSCYIQLMYEESGMCFVGCWDSEGADDHYDYGEFTSDNIKDNIPEYLVEHFALDEQLAQYEEEEDDLEFNPLLLKKVDELELSVRYEPEAAQRQDEEDDLESAN